MFFLKKLLDSNDKITYYTSTQSQAIHYAKINKLEEVLRDKTISSCLKSYITQSSTYYLYYQGLAPIKNSWRKYWDNYIDFINQVCT